MRRRRVLADRPSRHPTRRAVRCSPACPARSEPLRPRTTCSSDRDCTGDPRIGALACRRHATLRLASPRGTRAARSWIGSDRTPGLVAAHASRGCGRRLAGDDVLCRLEVSRLAGEREGDQDPEGGPERGHEGRREALHVVVLAGRHDCACRQPGAGGDQQGKREPTDDEEPGRQRCQPVHMPCLQRVPAGVARRRRRPGRRSSAPVR